MPPQETDRKIAPTVCPRSRPSSFRRRAPAASAAKSSSSTARRLTYGQVVSSPLPRCGRSKTTKSAGHCPAALLAHHQLPAVQQMVQPGQGVVDPEPAAHDLGDPGPSPALVGPEPSTGRASRRRSEPHPTPSPAPAVDPRRACSGRHRGPWRPGPAGHPKPTSAASRPAHAGLAPLSDAFWSAGFPAGVAVRSTLRFPACAVPRRRRRIERFTPRARKSRDGSESLSCHRSRTASGPRRREGPFSRTARGYGSRGFRCTPRTCAERHRRSGRGRIR